MVNGYRHLPVDDEDRHTIQTVGGSSQNGDWGWNRMAPASRLGSVMRMVGAEMAGKRPMAMGALVELWVAMVASMKSASTDDAAVLVES